MLSAVTAAATDRQRGDAVELVSGRGLGGEQKPRGEFQEFYHAADYGSVKTMANS